MKEPLEPGLRIRETYEVVRPFDSTDLSTAYLARASNGTYYVVRDIHPPGEERQMERIIAQATREAQNLHKLRFQGLPVILDAFGWEGRAFVVREYSDDPTIIDVLENMRGMAPENQVRGWMGQLLDMYGYLHEQKPPFIFKGLLPRMITLSKMGRLHIRDYPAHIYLTAELQWKYTRRAAPGFMSPEQERGEQLTPASDVYNLGQLMFFMLTRKDPALYPYSRNIMSIARPDATEVLLSVLDDATVKTVDKRLKTVADFRQNLTGGAGKGRSDRDIGFNLDTREIRVDNVKRGDILKRKVGLNSKTGREIYGKVRADRDWIRFKFDVFRGSNVNLEFSISTYDFDLGERYHGVIQLDTDAGVDEIEVIVTTASTIGSIITKGIKSLFGKSQPQELGPASESDF